MTLLQSALPKKKDTPKLLNSFNKYGLTKRPELNGMTGTIHKWSCKLGQYLVDMDENGSKVALKAECLSILVRE